MWGSLKHDFVLPFIGIYEEEDGMAFLVSPYMKNGTLAQWRTTTNPSIAQITERVWFFLPLALHRCLLSRKMLEVAQGMEYIHSEGVVHGDLRGVRYIKHSLLKF
jgi:serine/threonine protein kinase